MKRAASILLAALTLATSVAGTTAHADDPANWTKIGRAHV